MWCRENIPGKDIFNLGLKLPQEVQQFNNLSEIATSKAAMIKETKNILAIVETGFFQVHIQTFFTNSIAQNLILYDSRNFGKRFINSCDTTNIYNEILTALVK